MDQPVVIYATPTPNYMPRALAINGEAVWAEISDLVHDTCAIYVTRTPPDSMRKPPAWHVWYTYADDDGSHNFSEVEALHTSKNDQSDYSTFSEALQEAASLATEPGD